VSKPVAIQIECFNTQKIDIKKIENAIIQIFDMSLFEIIMLLELQNPIYMQTSYFGHFTKDNLP
jgi:S-adenosylmethionine synthetase